MIIPAIQTQEGSHLQTEEMEEILSWVQVMEEWVAMEEVEGDIVLPMVIMEVAEEEAIPEEGQEDLNGLMVEAAEKPVAVAAHILIRDN